MRLIDADELEKHKVWIESEGRWMIPLSIIIGMPTAYDIDKVVEQMKEKLRETIALRNNCIALSDSEANGIAEKTYRDAIEIVKRGGGKNDK